MKNVLIVGLGLMGGSFALALKEKGICVRAYDVNPESLDYGVSHGFIDEKAEDVKKALKESDTLIYCASPSAFIPFLKEYKEDFPSSLFITDIIGVKGRTVSEAEDILKGTDTVYVSIHPMAGGENSGAAYARKNLFKGVKVLAINTPSVKEEGKERVRELCSLLETDEPSFVSSGEHDSLIAYVSDLTHVLAVALVNAHPEEDISLAAGTSYNEMSRVGKINAELWTSLFLENKDKLIDAVKRIQSELYRIEEALKNGDSVRLKELLLSSYGYKKELEEKKK